MRAQFKVLIAAMLVVAASIGTGCSAKPVAESPAAPSKVGAYTVATTDEVKTALEGTDVLVVDARDNNAFIGWPLDGATRGGHIEGATDFSANWLAVKGADADAQKAIDEKLAKLVETKGLKTAKSAIVYDTNGTDSVAVADYLKKTGVADVKVYDFKEWDADSVLPVKAYPNYELIVPASYVNEAVENSGTADVKIFEVSWGEESDDYQNAHIPGAVHINTDEVEVGPVWNRVADPKLQQFALNNGVTTKTKVLLYCNGNDSMAAYRVQAIMKYMGVEDVRTLNGGFDAWTRAGYPTEKGSNKKVKVAEFGATVPVRDEYIVDMPEAKAILADPTNASLVDIRSWDEHIGKTPGYSDIKEAGRPEGCRYGGDMPGDNANVDGTMRNFEEVLSAWAEWGIEPKQKLAFFCGTGWRAAEMLIYADVAGLQDVHLYDGGWYEWIMRGENPKAKGEPTKP